MSSPGRASKRPTQRQGGEGLLTFLCPVEPPAPALGTRNRDRRETWA